MEFRLTFGQQYRREPHPLGAISHPDGWVTVIAPDEKTARQLVLNKADEKWAFLYDMDDVEGKSDAWWRSFHPLGELARWEA